MGLPAQLSGDKDSLSATLEKQPGVVLAGAAWRATPDRLGSPGRSFEMLAVDPIKFNRVSFYNDIFPDTDLFPLLSKLGRGRSTVRGLDLSADATAIGIWANPVQPYQSKSVWVTVRDGTGAHRNVRLGRLDFDDWTFLQGDLAGRFSGSFPPPLALLSVWIWELDFPEDPVPIGTINRGFTSNGKVAFSDLTLISPAAPEGSVLRDLTTSAGWRPLLTNAILQESLEPSETNTRDGRKPSLELEWTSVPGVGLRGFYPTDYDRPLPVVASSPLPCVHRPPRGRRCERQRGRGPGAG